MHGGYGARYKMMAKKPLAKLSGPNLDGSIEFAHPNVYQRETYPTWSRLTVGASDREVRLILELCKRCSGPFGILYVLVASRLGRENGRYQNDVPVEYDDLERFLYDFQEFLEEDGRHHVWVQSLGDEQQFVFDNHNVVYAYGDIDRIEAAVKAAGFSEGEVLTPVPHSHNYHPEFDSEEDRIMEYWSWTRFPLQPGDDDP